MATSDTGDVGTAYEFRDLFLEAGVRHENFSCPFCGVPLIAKCVYPKMPCVKAPHFAFPPGGAHKPWCERCEVETVGPPSPTNPKAAQSRVLLRDVELPEALVPRRIKQVKLPMPGTSSWIEHTEASARRVRASLTTAALPQRQTTSLLQNIADAYHAARGRVGAKLRAEGKRDAPFWHALNGELAGFPLKLHDEHLNYSTAFRSPTGIVRGLRIYHGSNGMVERHGANLVIRERPRDIANALGAPPLRASVLVVVPPTRPDEPAWQRNFRERLVGWSRTSESLRWFCLGRVEYDASGPYLAPATLDSVYAFTA